MAKARKSIMSLVQDYMTEGAGAESTGLLEHISSSSPITSASNVLQPTNYPTNKPANKEKITPPQAVHLEIKKSVGHQDSTIESAIEPTIEQTNNQTIKQTNEQPDQQSSKQSSKQSTRQYIEQSSQQTIKQTIKQSSEQSNQQSKYMWMPLNVNQGRILLFLYEQGGGLTNMDLVCMETGIAYGTARNSIDVLMKEGYVTNKTRHNGHLFRGFEYSLNNHLCSLYVTKIREQLFEQSPQQSTRQSTQQSDKQTIEQSIKQTNNPFSSKVLEKNLNLTTTEPTSILNEPELRFWAGEGVTEKQIQNWMDEFQLSIEEISLSLRYGRFDILERGDIQNSANWFYKILTRNGFYPKPQNYKSLIEIKAEALSQQQARDREARTQLETVEFESRFNSFLSDTSSALYQELYAQVSQFAREMSKEGNTMAATIELKELLKRKLNLSARP